MTPSTSSADESASSGSSDRVRPEGELDPLDLRSSIRVFSRELEPGESIAVREMAYYLRASGADADASTLRSVGSDASDRLEQGWFGDVSRYLALLPNVDSSGGSWRWVDEPREPDAPSFDEPTIAPTDEQRREARKALDVETPYSTPERTTKTAVGLRVLYDELIDAGELSTRELYDVFADAIDADDLDDPHWGILRSPGDWFREYGRGALSSLPGVREPTIAGEPWRFMGVDADRFETVELDRDRVGDAIGLAIDGASFGGRGAWASKRRSTVRDLAETIRESGSDGVTAKELIGSIDPTGIGYGGSSAFYNERARDVLADLPGMSSSTDDGVETWTFDRDRALERLHDRGNGGGG